MAHQEASDIPIDTLSIPYPILDSHIHLYPQSELHTLAWYTPDNPIGRQHSLQEYTSDTKSAPSLEGFIFVETDRIHDLKTGEEDGSGWEFPLVEVDWLTRIATGRPREGEGHDESQKGLCKAIVAWAPVPSGEKAIAQYVQKVKDRAGDAFPKVRGFRYLVQGKPSGTMTTEKFVEGLRYLGREGFSFDLGVDHHRDGDWIVEEALELVTRTHKDVPEEEKCTFILGMSFFTANSAERSEDMRLTLRRGRPPLQARLEALQTDQQHNRTPKLHHLARSDRQPQPLEQSLRQAVRLLLRDPRGLPELLGRETLRGLAAVVRRHPDRLPRPNHVW